LQSQKHEFFAAGRGGAQPNINQGIVKGWPIPVPSIDEQHKIVELLEDHLSRLDAALADVKQAKAKAAQFRSALLQSIFEGKYSATSDTWEFRSIGNFAEVKGGKRLPKGTKWSDKPTLHPYIRATDIKFGQIKVEDLVHVPDFVWKSISRYVVEENDVVITIAGTIGDVAVVPRILAGANLTENAAKLVFDHDYVMPSYLSMYLQSPSVQQEFKELSRATTQAKLALYRIATVKIPIPTLYEQQKIMELVDEKLTYLTSSLNQISASELHASSLRRALLQAAFTGQLTNEVVSV
jgi:type I restriction enzyme S subunit